MADEVHNAAVRFCVFHIISLSQHKPVYNVSQETSFSTGMRICEWRFGLAAVGAFLPFYNIDNHLLLMQISFNNCPIPFFPVLNFKP